MCQQCWSNSQAAVDSVEGRRCAPHIPGTRGFLSLHQLHTSPAEALIGLETKSNAWSNPTHKPHSVVIALGWSPWRRWHAWLRGAQKGYAYVFFFCVCSSWLRRVTRTCITRDGSMSVYFKPNMVSWPLLKISKPAHASIALYKRSTLENMAEQ